MFRVRSETIEVYDRPMPLAASRLWRIVTGILLVLGGLFSFLPVLGIWMVPLGLLVLSIDLPAVRRWRRRWTVWWYKRCEQRRAASGRNPTA